MEAHSCPVPPLPATLDARQREVVKLAGQGYRKKEIAIALGLSERRARQVIDAVTELVENYNPQRDQLAQLACAAGCHGLHSLRFRSGNGGG